MKDAHMKGFQKARAALRAAQTTLVLLSAATIETAFAADKITAPSFVNSVSASDLQDAGKEINGWIFAGMAVVIALMSVRPGYYWITGDGQKGWEHAKDILIGVAVAAVLGGVAFSVASKLG